MNRARPETWSKTAETILLALAFLAPLARLGTTWDPSALRAALVQSCALSLAAAWALKGLARGRWEAPAGAWPALLPALALGAWACARFALEPFKLAALSAFTLDLAAGIVFVVALLEFGGARHASRLAFWTAAAAAVLAATGGRLLSGDSAAAFAAVALPVVLALTLDPESSPVRRTWATAAAVALGFVAARAGAPAGAIFFAASACAFAVAVAALRRAAAWPAALPALGAAVVGALGAATGAAPAVAPHFERSALPFLAAAALVAVCGLRAARGLRARGALAESGYAVSFSAGFAVWALAAASGMTPRSGPGAWLACAAAGVAAGMAPLSRAQGVVRTFPLPFGSDVRRLMQGPVVLAFAALVAWPGLWFASDVSFNRAVAEARAKNLDAAYAHAASVRPGAAAYAPSLLLRGRILAEQGKPREALDAYALLDGVAPDLGRVHARKAEAYAALGDWSSAARERETQAGRSPADLGNLIAWAEAARAAGDLPAARRAAARAESLAPEDPATRTALAENALMERTLAEREAGRHKNGRKGLAFKPKAR